MLLYPQDCGSGVWTAHSGTACLYTLRTGTQVEQLKWQDMPGMVELDHTPWFLVLAAIQILRFFISSLLGPDIFKGSILLIVLVPRLEWIEKPKPASFSLGFSVVHAGSPCGLLHCLVVSLHSDLKQSFRGTWVEVAKLLMNQHKSPRISFPLAFISQT